MRRIGTIAALTLFICVFIWSQTNQYLVRSVWAQAIQPTIPINFTGGTNCTVLIPAVAGQRVYIQNGAVVIPAIGTGLQVTFLATTSTGFVPGLPGAGTTCGPSGTNLTLTAMGSFLGAQVGTTATNPVFYPLIGPNASFITPTGQGLAVQVSAATVGQPVTGYITAIQQP